MNVSVSGGYVYLANDTGGMYIFRVCAMLTDGFESDDTSAWSAAVP